MGRNVEVLPSGAASIARALQLVLDKINTATCDRGQCTIVLAGGSTPKALYEAIAKENLPWEKIHVFWGDERYVPQSHPDSNQGMARRAWLDKVDIPAGNIHPMPTDAGDPALDAQKYEAELEQFFKSGAGKFPVFDIVLLGMGDDGHTASLFPHTEALQVRDRKVAVGNSYGQPRLTLTVPLINQARCVIFIALGANKQSALAQVFASVADDMAYPSRLIGPQGELWWLLDESAGGNLNLVASQPPENY